MKINREYKDITENILENEYFLSLKNDIHHGTNKYDHCKRVSRLSFFMAKVFRAKKEEVARAGLLHDFFWGSRRESDANSFLRHPFTSASNAENIFNISKREKDIIECHMYHNALIKNILPFTKEEEKYYYKNYKPKNKESVIVCVADLLVSVFECVFFESRYAMCMAILFIINYKINDFI